MHPEIFEYMKSSRECIQTCGRHEVSLLIKLHCSSNQESLRQAKRGHAVAIVEKLPERMGTAFPPLKCLKTHYGGINCEQYFAYNISKKNSVV